MTARLLSIRRAFVASQLHAAAAILKRAKRLHRASGELKNQYPEHAELRAALSRVIEAAETEAAKLQSL